MHIYVRTYVRVYVCIVRTYVVPSSAIDHARCSGLVGSMTSGDLLVQPLHCVVSVQMDEDYAP